MCATAKLVQANTKYTWPLIALISHEIRTIVLIAVCSRKKEERKKRIVRRIVSVCVEWETKKHEKTRRNYIFIGNKQQWQRKKSETKKKRKTNLHFLLIGERGKHAERNRTSIKEKVNEQRASSESSAPPKRNGGFRYWEGGSAFVAAWQMPEESNVAVSWRATEAPHHETE